MEGGPLSVVVHGLLTAVASPVGEHEDIRSWGTRASMLCGRWDIPGPGVEPVSPAVAGGF